MQAVPDPPVPEVFEFVLIVVLTMNIDEVWIVWSAEQLPAELLLMVELRIL